MKLEDTNYKMEEYSNSKFESKDIIMRQICLMETTSTIFETIQVFI
jgi:hypothetical protein